jgi:putative membrane protein
MNLKRKVIEVGGLILIALPAYAQFVNHSQQVSPTRRDERTVSFIHQVNLFEIETSKLAQAKSSSQDVKDFAAQMITDHTSADELVRSYAQSKGIDLDALQGQLMQANDVRLQDEREAKTIGSATGEWAFTWENANVAKDDDSKTMARLRKLQGAAFDREYASAMVKGHQHAVDRLVGVRDRGIDPALRDLIDQLLPVVRHHLEMAQALVGVVAKA